MKKGITINPNIMNWAIKSSGKNLDDLYGKFDKINEWKSKESVLTVNELKSLSSVLQIPFGYFFLEEPPIEDIPLLKYRTVDNIEQNQPSRNLIDTIREMEMKQEFMRDFIIEDGFAPLPFVNSITIDNNPIEVAYNIREYLQLDKNWNTKKENVFNTLRNAASNIGILVMQNGVVGNNNQRPLDVAEFRAFVLVDKYTPLIFINTKDSNTAKTFSLCHELVHIWLGIDELYNDNQIIDPFFNNEKVETFCNEVAAEFLLPTETISFSFKYEYKNKDIYETIESISNKFNTSELVTCIRLKNLQFISKHEFDKIYSILLEKMHINLQKKELYGNSKNNGGNYYRTLNSKLDRKFVNIVNQKAREGKILYRDAYKLIGAKGKTYDNFINFVKGEF